MKVRASIKKRNADCKIVRRKGHLYVINQQEGSENEDASRISAIFNSNHKLLKSIII